MIKRYLVVGIFLLFILMSINPSFAFDNVKKSSLSVSNGNWLYVGGNGEGNYSKIQDAIDDAVDGDTVFVYDDSSPYYGTLIVNKSINLMGQDKNTTIIDGTNNYFLLKIIQAKYVTIESFSIINADIGIDYVDIGIDSFLTKGCTIKDNIIASCNYGIFYQGSYLNFTNNILSNITYYGITVHGIGNDISYNNITNNGDGIHLGEISSNNIISYNSIISNNGKGINLYFSNNNTIKNNIISKNEFGIVLSGSGNILMGNHITLNRNDGMNVFDGFNTIIKNNFIGNKREAFFGFTPFNLWRENYWNEPRILPKLIIGYIWLFNQSFLIPWFNADWHPAKEPYDISTGV